MRNVFSVKTFLGVLVGGVMLSGCSVSQEAILGEASTTTEAVLMESHANDQEIEQLRLTSQAFERDFKDEYRNSFDVRRGVAELAPRVNYLPNPRRVLYFYPRLTALGNLEPGYAIEYPTYKEIHVSK